MHKDVNRQFTNEDIQVTNKHIKDVQLHYSSSKYNLNTQHDITIYLSE